MQMQDGNIPRSDQVINSNHGELINIIPQEASTAIIRKITTFWGRTDVP